jgi:hypothetical protein
MRDPLEARLAQLEDEFQRGRAMLKDLEAQERQLQETLLRISGAMQVLHELLGDDAETKPPERDGVRAGVG